MKFYFKNYINLTDEEKISILKIRNADVIRKNMYNPDVIPLEDHLNWISNLDNRKDCIYWAIFADNQLVGSIDLTSINLQEKFAEWGFYIDNQYLGLGALIEYLGMEHFIVDMQFEKILACVLDENKQVYNMHKHKFNYIDAPDYTHIKNNKKYNALILSNNNWYVQKDKIRNILTKVYKIEEVIWE